MPAYPSANPKQFIQGAPVLHVPDVQATARYYRDVLGFTWGFGDETYSVVWRDNSALHFVKDDRPPVGIHLFQWVRDVDAYHDEIAKRGAQVASAPANQPYGIRELAIRDINGIGVVFGQDIEPGVRPRKERRAEGETTMNAGMRDFNARVLEQTEKDSARQFLTQLDATFHARVNILLVAESLLLAALAQVWGSRELGIILLICLIAFVLTKLLWDPLKVLAERTKAVARLLNDDVLYQTYIDGSPEKLHHTHRLANWLPKVFFLVWTFVAALAVLRAFGLLRELTVASAAAGV